MSEILTTRCPECSYYGQHRVTKTDKKNYRWNDRSSRRLKESFKHGLDFRKHFRECKNCGKEFAAYEISKRDFGHIMSLWQQDECGLKNSKEKVEETENKNRRMTAHFDTFLKRRGSGCITSLSQDVGMLWMELGHDVIHSLKEGSILTFQDILLSPKSELMQKGNLTEAQWQKVAKLFADSGLTLEDDTPSVAA